MAYTRTWDSTTPTATSQLSAGDDAIRALKVDIEERLSALLEDIDADPPSLQSDIVGTIGSKTGKQIIIGPHAFVPVADDDNTSWEAAYVAIDDGPNFTIRASVVLPIGVTVTKIEMLGDKNTADGITCVLKGAGFSAAPSAPANKHTALSRTAAGVGIEATGTLAIAVVADELLFLEVAGDVNGNARLYGVRITYDASDATETL